MSDAVAGDELARLDACGTAALIRSGKASTREVCTAAIARIEALNPTLNAVVRTRYDQALDELDRVAPDAPFAGVPSLIKDVVIEGEPFYNGSKTAAGLDMRAAATDIFVDRMRAMGLVILGETNIPEFTSAPTTESVLHGPARNPWATGRSTGGSSGGAGAAVASLMVPAAQSSDGGGSSRIPASACGLFAIKTSRGRTPLGPSGSGWFDITSAKGFLTRSVRDSAALLDALGRPDPAETLIAPPPVRPFAQEVGADPGTLRIGFALSVPGNIAPLDPEARAAVEQAAALLADLGHHVEEAAPETFLSNQSWFILNRFWPLKVAMRASVIEKRLGRPLEPHELEPGTYKSLESARGKTMVDVALILQEIRDFSRTSLGWWRDYDILLTPCTGSVPPPLGLLGDMRSVEGRTAWAKWGALCPFANITGQPSTSVPLYWSPQGLPIGAQFFADIGREDVLIRLASQLEAARPWADRLPPLLRGDGA